MKPDIEVSQHGSIFLLRPMNERAELWFIHNTTEHTVYNGCITVELRYLPDILDALADDGLEVIPV